MEDCLFCKIIAGEIPAEKIFEDDTVLAFNDIDPKAPTHILIIPKKHYPSIHKIPEENLDIISALFKRAGDIAVNLGYNKSGYRLVVNSGEDGGQTVNHLHIHLLGGRSLQWPPG